MSICVIGWGFPTPILKRLRDETKKSCGASYAEKQEASWRSRQNQEGRTASRKSTAAKRNAIVVYFSARLDIIITSTKQPEQENDTISAIGS